MSDITQQGNWDKTTQFLGKIQKFSLVNILHTYGQKGVNALASVTPQDTGAAANSWEYDVIERHGYVSLRWYNTANDEKGRPIVILLQYGHATRNGGYVQGQDFINPVIQPIFDEIADAIWKEVTQ